VAESIEEMTTEERLGEFPNLSDGTYELKSEDTKYYNCVAWVVGITYKRIDSYGYWWPEDLEATHTANSYAELYKRYFGFEICDNSDYEDGYDKIALYSDKNNLFTHATRRINNKCWTSKMGDYEDIEHYNLTSVGGGDYGKPTIFMKRKIIDK